MNLLFLFIRINFEIRIACQHGGVMNTRPKPSVNPCSICFSSTSWATNFFTADIIDISHRNGLAFIFIVLICCTMISP